MDTEGSTPQSAPVVEQQPQNPVVVIPVANPHGNESAPFLINEENPFIAPDSNHDDPQLSKQTTVINLNNKNVRITIWCIIYVIFTTLSVQLSSTFLVYYNTDTDYDTDSDKDKEIRLYSLSQSTNSVLWWAAVIILCNLYCKCCNCKCMPFSAFLFVIGGILMIVTMSDGIGMTNNCADDYYNKEEKHYCRVSWFAAYSFPVLFSFYMALDAIRFIGNDIRIRISVSAAIIAVRSFLWFLIYQYELSQIQDEDSDSNKRYIATSKYSLKNQIGANFSLFFWCLMVLIIIGMGYGNLNDPNKKLNVWIRRIVGWFIIGATGAALLNGFGWGNQFRPYSTWWYFAPAAAFLAYDIQYL